MFSNGTKAAVLRKTSNNNYIYKAKTKHLMVILPQMEI
jgi:hypothetical protein